MRVGQSTPEGNCDNVANLHMFIILLSVSLKLRGATLFEIINPHEKRSSREFNKNSAKLTVKFAQK